MSDSVIAIVSAFFIIGITVGGIAVIALSVLRSRRLSARSDPGRPLKYRPPGPGEPPDLRWDDADPDHPRWPGKSDNDFSGR